MRFWKHFSDFASECLITYYIRLDIVRLRGVELRLSFKFSKVSAPWFNQLLDIWGRVIRMTASCNGTFTNKMMYSSLKTFNEHLLPVTALVRIFLDLIVLNRMNRFVKWMIQFDFVKIGIFKLNFERNIGFELPFDILVDLFFSHWFCQFLVVNEATTVTLF